MATPVTFLLLAFLIIPAVVAAAVGYRLRLPRPFIAAAVVLVLWIMNTMLGRPFDPIMASFMAAAGAGTLTVIIWYVGKLNVLMTQRALRVGREERARLAQADSHEGEDGVSTRAAD